MADNTSQRITARDTDYNRWYQDVIRQGQLAEPAEVVKGCMVIRPHGYAIWEKIQAGLDARFKATGHQNAYFPLLIPESFIKREAEHVEGFAPELAVVTHAGGKQLEERYVIRPTSETIVGHFFSRWIESYRDLPLLINQWANVMRWELRTRMFLRTSEFLWQEGHTAHETHQEAQIEVRKMLLQYAEFCEQTMAMPVIRGVKTQTEKFAGALQSHCIEAMMQDGKALQAGTSHDLGQNFGKAFNVRFQTRAAGMDYVWQTSWGTSTRLVGGLIMTHSDDRGLVLPPKLAPVQIAIVPILNKNNDNAAVLAAANALADELKAAGIAAVCDTREHKPGFKYFEWEQKGVPIRVELGPRDISQGAMMIKERLADSKYALRRDNAPAQLQAKLDAMQTALFVRAKKRQEDMTQSIDTFDDFKDIFAGNKSQFVMAHWDGTAQTEAKIKEQTKATIRCIPYDSPLEPGTCIYSKKASTQRVLFAKSY